MKKFLLSFSAIIVSGMLFAQTGNVQNFSMVSSTGQSVDLYTVLGQGKVVIADIWFNECSWCRQYAPMIEQIYQAKGAGAGNVDIWGINSQGQSNTSINSYKTTYGVTNKCFGNTGSTGSVNALQKIYFGLNPNGSGNFGTPAYVVICPNKKGWWAVNYPPTLTGFDTYITQCGASGNGVYNIVRDETQARFVSIYPNPGTNDSKIDFFIAERGKVEITMFNLLGAQVGVIANETFDAGTHTLDFSAQLPAGNYIVKMITENGIADVTKLVIVN